MKERSKSLMLLLEITIMILIFAFCAAVCLSLFSSSRRMSREADENTGAAMWAQSAAEAYKAAGGDMEAAAGYLGAEIHDGALELGLDKEWNVGGSEYLLRVVESGADARVTVTRGMEELFSIDVKAVAYG